MAGSSWIVFLKSIGLPMFIALSLYVFVFLIFLPLYRRHRSHLVRYSDYTPLSSGLAQRTTSIFEPYLLEPSVTLVQKIQEVVGRGVRWFLISGPRPWESRTVRERRMAEEDEEGEEEDEHGGLFDVESGEAMVGFDFQRDQRGRGRTREGDGRAGLNVGVDMDDSNRRLSRELEEGFKDDSASEASDEEVTAGRRSVSRRRHGDWT